MKKIKQKIMDFVNSLCKIKVKNIIYVIAINILLTAIFFAIRFIVPELLNIHLKLNINADFIAIYSNTISLLLSLAILLVDKIHEKHVHIIMDTYLYTTKIFPILAYFCTNLIILIFVKDQYYCIITILISIIFIIYIYYKTFKLLTNLKYEKQQIQATSNKLINHYLEENKKIERNNIKINQYAKYGIFTNQNYNQYLKPMFSLEYQKKNIVMNKMNYDSLRIIDYDYSKLDKIKKNLSDINKDYVDYMENTSNEIQYPKIIIILQSVNSILNGENSAITIYYTCDTVTKRILNIINNEIYITKENDDEKIIMDNFENIKKNCIEALRFSSESFFNDELMNLFNIYKVSIDYLSEYTSKFSPNDCYKNKDIILKNGILNILKQFKINLYDFLHIIIKQNDEKLLSTLIGFVYNMILYSYSKNELISIEYFYSIYISLNKSALELEKKFIPYDKIKIEIFDLINTCEFNIYHKENIEFNKYILLTINTTLSKILFDLSKQNDEYFLWYLNDVLDFIDMIDNDNTNSGQYEEIWEKYSSNFFATISYIANKQSKNKKIITKIIEKYKKYNTEKLTAIVLKTIEMDGSDPTFSWHLLDFDEEDASTGLKDVNTIYYILHLYCHILNSKNLKKIPLRHELINYSNILIDEFKKLNKTEWIDQLTQFQEEIKNQHQRSEKNDVIRDAEIKQFNDEINTQYIKTSKLYNLFLQTNNIEPIINSKESANITLEFANKNFDTIEKHSKKIEEYYLQNIKQQEEKQYYDLIIKKGKNHKGNITKYLKRKTLYYNNYIIFANFASIYNLFSAKNLIYDAPNNKNNIKLKPLTHFIYNDKTIPIYDIEGLNNNEIYLINTKSMGKLELYNTRDFKAEVKEMNKEVLIFDFKNEKEKVKTKENIYITFQKNINLNDNNMKSLKFTSKIRKTKIR